MVEKYKFKNETGRTLKTRVTHITDHSEGQVKFKVIKPNDEVVLEEGHGTRLGLTKKSLILKDGQEATKKELQYPHNLTTINGIGAKLSETIGELFPKEDDLKQALQNGEDLELKEATYTELKKFYGLE